MSRATMLWPEESKAVRRLKKLAKEWPKSLWLWSASGTLYIMKKDENGEVAMDGEGVHRDYIVDSVEIENDGGDW